MTAFYHGLTLAPQPYIAICWLSYSELLGQAYYVHMVAIPNEDTWLGRPDEYGAVFTIIHVHTGIGVENKNWTLLAIRYLELLHMQWSRFLYKSLKPGIFEQEILSLEFVFILRVHLALCFIPCVRINCYNFQF